jgi:hypothetical protein
MELRNALEATKGAGFFIGHRKADRMIRVLRAAIISAKKQFGVPELVFSGEGMPGQFVQVYREYIESFLPYVSAGHVPEARQSASHFIRTLGDD